MDGDNTSVSTVQTHKAGVGNKQINAGAGGDEQGPPYQVLDGVWAC